LSQVEGLERLFSFGAAVSEMRPEVMDNLDPDAAFRFVADVAGVPAKVLRPAEEVEDIRADRQAQQDQAMAEQGIREDAAALGKAAPALQMLTGTGGNAS
jgi:hypothetical protein